MFTPRRKISIEQAAKHPKVSKALSKTADMFDFKIRECKAVMQGGQSIIFLIKQGRKRLLLKLPNYATRHPREHWVLEHDIAKEGQILAHLHISAVPKIYAYASDGHYLLKEWVEGMDFATLVTQSTLSDTLRRKYLTNLAQTTLALFEAFHCNPVGCYAMRDFKPKNIIYDEAINQLRLVDVGSARPETDMVAASYSGLHKLGSGKWLYWPPEQLMGAANLCDRRVDYFAFGMMAFFVLTGVTPYSNRESCPRLVLGTYISEYADAVVILKRHAVAIGLSLSAVTFLVRCLSPNPHDRPSIFNEETLGYFT